MTHNDTTKTETPKRKGRNQHTGPSAFQYATSRNDGTSLVCYKTTAGPDGFVFAVFDGSDLDIARGCYPAWDARCGGYRLVRNATALELSEGRGSTIRVYQLVLERKLGRRLDVRGTSGEVCDHIDGDQLNNRRSNLRAVSNRGNSQNRVDPPPQSQDDLACLANR